MFMMHTTRSNCAARRSSAGRLFAVLAAFVGLVSSGLVGCASTKPQRASTNSKPGNNAPHEERNPSQHPEQFR